MTGSDLSHEQSGGERSASGSHPRGFLLLRGLVLPISPHHPFVLGRERNECNVALTDERVSKRHASIAYRNGRYIIKDMGSLNGVYVNGDKIEGECVLMPGDEIQIRPFTMLFIGADAVASGPILEAPAFDAEPSAHLSGELSIIRLADLIQLLNSTAQTGLLKIQDPSGDAARLVFEHGEITRAVCGAKQSEQAVYTALGIKEGRFSFTEGHHEDSSEPIRKRTVSMLLEGFRVIDETGEKEKTQPIDLPERDG